MKLSTLISLPGLREEEKIKVSAFKQALTLNTISLMMSCEHVILTLTKHH